MHFEPLGKTFEGGIAPEVTTEMMLAGMTAFRDFRPEDEEPEALVWEILYRALAARTAPQRV